MADEQDNSGEDSSERLNSDKKPFETIPTDQKPAQIPLLDDVVFNTSLPFAKPQPRPKGSPKNGPKPIVEPGKNVPRPTDLFGGSPDTAQSGPLAPHYIAPDIDQATAALRGNTERVVDNLVAEYSKEIIERLRDDLTLILQDLDRGETPNKDSDPS